MWKTSKTKQEAGFGAVVAFSGGAASFVGLLALSGWITGLRTLAGIRSDYLPMSPDTALAFVFLGLILLLHLDSPIDYFYIRAEIDRVRGNNG
jgi:hypothetical protein